MNVVVDTNVFISGAFFFGPPHEILLACETGALRLVLSLDILAEYRRVGLGFLHTRSDVDYETLLEMHHANAVVVNASALEQPVIRMTTSFSLVQSPATPRSWSAETRTSWRLPATLA